MHINRFLGGPFKWNLRRTAGAIVCSLLISAVFCSQCLALGFGKAKEDDGDAPDMVPKVKLSKDQQSEFDTTLKNGDTYLKSNNFELAKICFMRASTLNPGAWQAHLGLAICHVGQNKVEQAQMEAFEAVRCAPNEPQPRFVLGQLMMKDARWDEAGGQFLQVLKQNPDDLGARGNLATCLQMMGQIDPAIGQYKYILEKDPKSAQSAFNLAAAYEMKNLYDDAAINYKRVVQLDPNNANAYCSLAKCLIAKKDYKAAQVLLDHAKKLGIKNHFVHLMQGYLYEVQGERRPAIEEYTKAVALSPKDGDCQRSLQRMLESGGKIGAAGNLNRVSGGKLSVSKNGSIH